LIDVDIESCDKLLLELFGVSFRRSGLGREVDVDRWPAGQFLPVKPDREANGQTDAFKAESPLFAVIRKAVALPKNIL
jgi:hypothetical protein